MTTASTIPLRECANSVSRLYEPAVSHGLISQHVAAGTTKSAIPAATHHRYPGTVNSTPPSGSRRSLIDVPTGGAGIGCGVAPPDVLPLRRTSGGGPPITISA